MKSLLRLIFCFLFLLGWGLAAVSLHVVRYGEWKFGIVPKNRLSIDDTYTDVRGWSADDALKHADLVARLAAADKANWLTEAEPLADSPATTPAEPEEPAKPRPAPVRPQTPR